MAILKIEIVLMLISVTALISSTDGIDCSTYCAKKCGEVGSFNCIVACLADCSRCPPKPAAANELETSVATPSKVNKNLEILLG